MIKFKATNKWYELAAESEAGISHISAGPSDLSISGLLGNDVILKKNIREIRRLEGVSTLLKMLRLKNKLSVDDLASKLDLDVDEVVLLERQVGYKASPRTLVALAKFYDIPTQVFLQLIGASKVKNDVIEEEMIRFAAESEAFEKLTSEEKKLLNRVVKIISNIKG